MAAFTGVIQLKPTYTTVHDQPVTTHIVDGAGLSIGVQNITQNPYSAPGQVLGGALSSGSPVDLTKAHSGYQNKSFKHDYYNRVHVSPNPVNLGTILSTTNISVEVWNAYFSDNTLQSISEQSTDGIALIKPVVDPYVFKPLEYNTYQVSVTTDGPAVVDGIYTFDFTQSPIALSINGSRVTTFPFEPQWDKQITERLEWTTDILTSYDGSEQRVGLRKEPRRSVEFEILTNKLDNQRLDSILFDWLARPFAVPMWMDLSYMTSDSLAGSSTVSIDTVGKDYTVGESLIFITDTYQYETAEIASVTDSQITTKLPILEDQITGTKCYPVRVGRLQTKQTSSFVHREVDSSKFLFSFNSNTNTASTESSELYRSIPILTDKPSYSGTLKTEYESKVSIVDNKLSEVYVDVESPFTKVSSTFVWLKTDRVEMLALREWLHSRRGRLKPIWVPTWKQDLTVSSDEVVGSAALTVCHNNRTLHVDGKYNRRDIMIAMKDGSISYHRVSSSSDTGNVTEVLALDNVLEFDVTTQDIDLVCYVEHCRLSADAVEIQWITPDVMKIQVNFTTIYDDV